MLPCFRCGLGARLSPSIFKARMILDRLSEGLMISSRYPSRAAVIGLAIVDRLRRLTDADAVLDVVEKKVRWQSSESRGVLR